MKKMAHELFEERAIGLTIGEKLSFEEARKRFYEKHLEPTYRALAESNIDAYLKDIPPEHRGQAKAKFFGDRRWRYFLEKGENPALDLQYMLWCLYVNGHKVFIVDGDLADALYHTDVPVSLQSIRFPFNSFAVYIENSKIPYGSRLEPKSAELTLDAIWVDAFKFQNLMTIRFMQGADSRDTESPDRWRLMGWQECVIRKGDRLKIRQEDDDEIYAGIANFIFSLVIYVTTHPEDSIAQGPTSQGVRTRNLKKIRRTHRLETSESRYAVHYIGKRYSGLFKQAREHAAKYGVKLDRRVVVRGHWRAQWFGKKLDEGGREVPGQYQETIWIEPFYKGSDLEQFSKVDIYKVR